MFVLKAHINLHLSPEALTTKGFPLGFNNATALFHETMTNSRSLDGCLSSTEANSKNVKWILSITIFLQNCLLSSAKHN